MDISEKDLREKIAEFIGKNTDAIVADIARVVAVPSIEGEAAPGAPYGVEARRALDEGLAIAAGMGLLTNDGDGHVGWAELPGSGKGYLATISHMDVVPVDDGWDADPFTLRQREGWLIGRGVIDDKGPAILGLYLAKFFKENALPLRYGLRVLLGSNEETGMGDVEYYLAHNEQPLFCFSPDSEFPVCNAEKGVMSGDFISAPLAGNLVAFHGGIASNVIPDKAYCVVKADPATLKNTDHITVSDENGNARLDANGIPGHAAMPEGTLNGIGLLVDYLLEKGLLTEEENRFLALQKKLFSVNDGSGLGVDATDDIFDPLTCIGGMVRFEDRVLRQNINIRFPTSTTGDKLNAQLSAAADEHGATFKGERAAEPFYISPDSPAIAALLSAYSDVTGQAGETYTMGGGTYARHFQRAVAFGPSHKDMEMPDFVGAEHANNEGMRLDILLQALEIYILAIWRLQAVDF